MRTADRIFCNGTIYTADQDFKIVHALAVRGDRILYAGDAPEAYRGADTQIVDLQGRAVIPGLIEGHMHVDQYGFRLQALDIYWKSKEEILRAVTEQAKALGPGRWIVATGWNETLWPEKRYPDREELDAAAPENPVLLERYCGHMAWANTLAFRRAGVTADTPDPQGGAFLRRADGSLQGCMTDTTWDLMLRAIPEGERGQDESRLDDAMARAQASLFSYGITSAMDAGVSVERIEDYKRLYEQGALKLRLYPMLRLTGLDSPMAEYLRTHPVCPEEQYENRLLVRCVKLFADGALGARGARFLEDYSDRAGHRGELRHSDAEMDALVELAWRQGYQVAVHAIGDGAVRQVLNAYETVLRTAPRPDHRLRVEHFQVAEPADMDRAARLGVIASMQFIHAASDLPMAEARMGHRRIQHAYAWRSLLDRGIVLAGGTDAPYDQLNPFQCMYAAVARTALDGRPEGGWYPEQRITRQEALRAYTNGSAYAQFEEGLKGSLEAGKLADFAVLDRDLMTCPVEQIPEIQVEMTVCGGEIVYRRS